MTGTVSNIGYQIHISTFKTTKEAVNSVDKDLDNINILPLVEATDIVGLCSLTIMENGVNSPGVVFYIVKPAKAPLRDRRES